MKTFSLILFGVLAVSACSTSAGGKPASATCSSGGECTSGECLDLAVVTDGGCSSVGKACSKTCLTDPDCASLGPKFKCFDGCAGTKSCGATP